MDGTRYTTNVTFLAVVFITGSIVLMLVLAVGLGILRVLTLRPPPPPNLVVTNGPAFAGGTITLVGTDWPASQLVFVYLVDPGQADSSQVVISGRTNAQGQFTVSLPYPVDARWNTIPVVEVRVESQDGRARQSQRIPVLTATPTPTTGPTPLITATPSPTPTPTASATAQTFSDWRGEYFNNTGLSGTPALVRNDARLTFDWGNGSPDPALPADGFSARWTRPAQFQGATYRFRVSVDDGVRVYVNDTLVIDEWRVGSLRTITKDVALAAGTHNVRVEMFEQSGQSAIDFAYEPVVSFTDWKGEYFNNTGVSSNPILTRNDARVSFDWKTGSPDPALPADNFSARWTRAAPFQSGTYRFKATVDDGVRVFVDDIPVIDEWRVGSARTITRDVPLGAGQHNLRVEMFEQSGQAQIDFSYEQLITYDDWKGEYFASRDLSGSPALTRNDKVINFDWGNGSPASGLPADGFSARWTRTLNLGGGATRFVVRSDDGVRVTIDGTRLIDEWRDGSSQTIERDMTLAAGPHVVVVEYYENIGSASVAFVHAPSSFAGWKAEYFVNVELKGLPVLVRDDAQLDFNWGAASPAELIPVDGFSARWSRTLNLEPGTYRFSLIHDDGARLLVDGTKIIDEWRDGATTTNSETIRLSGGPHPVVVEFYERSGQSRAALSWARLSESPTPSLTPTASPTPSLTTTPAFTPTPSHTPSPSVSPTTQPSSR